MRKPKKPRTYNFKSGPYAVLRHDEIEREAIPGQDPGFRRVFGPLGEPARVKENSAEYFLCATLMYVPAAEQLPIFRPMITDQGLIASLLFAADEILEFERFVQAHPDAAAHVLGISFSFTPNKLAEAKDMTLSILARMAAVDACVI